MVSLGLIVAILSIAGLTTVKIDFDGLHNSAVCSSKSIGSVEFLEDDIGRVISYPIMAVEVKAGNARTHSLFSRWKWQLYILCVGPLILAVLVRRHKRFILCTRFFLFSLVFRYMLFFAKCVSGYIFNTCSVWVLFRCCIIYMYLSPKIYVSCVFYIGVVNEYFLLYAACSV